MGTHGKIIFVLCLLSFVLATFSANARVFINEVQSSNDQTILDEFGENSDWIELYNDGDEPVDLSGWGISDKEKKPFKGKIPDGTIIGPKGYLILFADGIGEGKTEVHVAISLGASGDPLFLKDKSENLIDSIEFGPIPCDCSFGRVGDGGETLKWFAEPTPGKANDKTPYENPLGQVTFSQERGVFTGSTVLSVALSYTNGEEGVSIYYTTDHSDPTTSSAKYTGTPIEVKGTTIIRATAVKEGHLPCRNIVTHSYIYLDQIAKQTKLSCAEDTWSDVSKSAEDAWIDGGRKTDKASLSKSSTKASYTVTMSNAPSEADFIAALKAAPIVSLTMSDRDFFNTDTSKGVPYGIYSKPVLLDDTPEGTRPASVEWVTGNHVLCSDVGLSIHGDGSRHYDYTPKKSFGLKFRGRYGASKLEAAVMDDVGYEQDEFKTLILRAESNHSWTHSDNPQYGTSMHDQFLRDVQGEMTGFKSHGTWVHVFINGLYWGLYNLCESFDNNYCEAQWGGEKLLWDVVTGSDLVKDSCEARDGTVDDYLAVFREITDLSASDPSNCYATACRKIDLDNFIDYMIMEWYCVNTDWPQKNWTMMMSTKLGEPMRFGLWDIDQSMASPTTKRVTTNTSGGYSGGKNCSQSVIYLQRALEKSPEYRLRFADRVYRHFYNDGAMTVAALTNRYAQTAKRVRPLVVGEAARWGTYRGTYNMSSWDKEYNRLTGLKTGTGTTSSSAKFFPNRWTTLKSELTGYKIGTVAAPLYPSVEAADFEVSSDRKSAMLKVPAGAAVYYTTDGSDPREAFTGNIHGQPYMTGQIITAGSSSTVKARAYVASSETWSALSEVELEAPPQLNAFLPTDNGKDWDKDGNWTFGYYPNAAGEKASIGVPTKVKENKGWRNIHINATNVTVGVVEVTNGGWTNRIDTGKSGSFILDGGTNELGEAQNATFTVMDASGAGLTMIDLDKPNAVRLGSDTTFTVGNTAGDANFGGLLIKGLLDGNGKNLKKAGAGRMTLSCAVTSAIGKLQCEEGVLAVLKPITVDEITKSGELWVETGSTDLEEAVAAALVSAGKCNPNISIFVPSEYGDATWYGGVVATKFGGTPTAYVPSASGEVTFDGRRWTVCAVAEIDTVKTASGAKTYRVKVPYFGPAIRVGGTDYATLAEAVAAANSQNPMVFAMEPTVDNEAHTVAIAEGAPVPVADHYDLALADDRRTVTLTLNAKALPVTVLATRITHSAGQSVGTQFKGFLTKKGLWYAWGKGGEPATDWVAGDDTPMELEKLKPEGGGWELMVRE